jgi:hypothetical protein
LPDQRNFSSNPRAYRLGRLASVFAVLWVGVGVEATAAENFFESFEGRSPTSRVTFSSETAELAVHRREPVGGIDARGCERVVVRTRRLGTSVSWEQSIPASRVIDDLRVTVSTWSRLRGLQLAVRVVFPHEVDPRTGRMLTDLVPGPRVARAGRWQQLTLTGLPDRLRERLVLLRARLKQPGLKGRDAYVDRVVLRIDPDPGATEWRIDDLRVGPIVPPRLRVTAAVNAESVREPVTRPRSPAVVQLDRLLVDDSPFLPRVVTYHGESPAVLKAAGANLVLVPDYRDRELISRLREADLWAMAVPPRPPTIDGTVVDAGTAALVPIGPESDGVLCWYMEPHSAVSAGLVTEDDIRRLGWNALTGWVDQLRVADRRMRRPIVADVVGYEHVISRQRLLPAISREVIQTGLPLKLYRQWLGERRDRVRPGALAWTWVRADSRSLTVEPEQIELQVRAALAAGYRGLGFRTSGPLDSDRPASTERLLMLGLINLELDLLSPFLATSNRVGRLPVTVGLGVDPNDSSVRTTSASSRKSSSADRLRRRRRVVATNPTGASDLDGPRADRRVQAVLFSTGYGRLLMTSWVGDSDQFVPGQMAVSDVSLVVPGGGETATAWELTTTGLRSVTTRRVAGGVALRLDRFDRGANIVFTSDPDLVNLLRRRIAEMSGRAARMALKLAQSRFDRVRQVDGLLGKMGHPQPDARRLVTLAADYLSRAAASLDQGALDASRRYSDVTLQTLRILQRAHWEQAVRETASPVASTWSRCFQTLPRHWELVTSIRSASTTPEPRLVGGDFEDLEQMVRSGWSSRRAEIAGMTMTAEVYRGSGGRDGVRGSCLRLLAQPDLRAAEPTRLPSRTVIVDSPPVPVISGDVVRISGRIRLVSARPGSLDGGVIEDTLGGPGAGLHCRRPGGWRRFELLRRVDRGEDLRIRVALEGVGELRVDDLQVEVFAGGLAVPRRSPTVNARVKPTARPVRVLR